MNLCKFIVDHMITCKSICLNKKEGQITQVKMVFQDAKVKKYFMKNTNETKNLPDQFKNSRINPDSRRTKKRKIAARYCK